MSAKAMYADGLSPRVMMKRAKHVLSAVFLGSLLLIITGCFPQSLGSDQLVGVWIAGESRLELLEDGNATMEQFPIDEGDLYSGNARWYLIATSDGEQVDLSSASSTHIARLHVDQDLFRITLYRVLCDPDALDCVVRFELQ
jgi:hypothetical protein